MRMHSLVAAAALAGLAPGTCLSQCFDDSTWLLESGDPSWRCNGTGVAADGLVALVGNPCGESNQPYFGYASIWTLDGATGAWSLAARLNPGDGSINGPNQFASSLAVSGSMAAVGASVGSYPGYSGAAYVYQENGSGSWAEVARLEAGSPAKSDSFGWSLAIDGEWILVGAIGDDGQDNNSGAAYFFHRVNGQWVRTQRVVGSAFGDRWVFGWSVDLDGNTAVISSPKQLGNRVFVFERTDETWSETAVLVGHDTEVGDEFGHSVAISGNTIVVCAPLEDEVASNAGAAYIFERDPDSGQWSETQKLTRPNDSANTRLGYGNNGGRGVAIEGDHLVVAIAQLDVAAGYERVNGVWIAGPGTGVGGDSVGLGGGTMISGHRDADGGGLAVVATCGIDGDLDEDGLLDSWESQGGGIDVNGDGVIDLDLYAMGARPDHKDLFLEVDVMDGGTFSQAGLDMVVDSFRFAPVENPDGDNGIELHVIVDELDIPNAPIWDDEFHDFDNIKAFYFGTPAERGDGNAEHILAAKRRAFRYCVLVDEIADATLGIAELPGDDMYVGLGGLSASNITAPRPFEWWFAHVFMHELGHMLGLWHGGTPDPDPDNPGQFQNVNHKPNYVSVMNYNFDHVAIENDSGDWVAPPITYSGEALPLLDESNLDETIGVSSPTLLYTDYWVPFTQNRTGGFLAWGWLKIDEVGVAKADYNDDGDTDDTGVDADLNYLSTGNSPGEIMGGFNDWANLQYGIGVGGDWDDFVHTPLEEPELSDAMATDHRENTPPPPVGCRADTNLDGTVDTRDVLAFLNLFAGGKGAADYNLDGVTDTRDVLAFLNDWVAGC